MKLEYPFRNIYINVLKYNQQIEYKKYNGGYSYVKTGTKYYWRYFYADTKINKWIR